VIEEIGRRKHVVPTPHSRIRGDDDDYYSPNYVDIYICLILFGGI
jgi:hypothetical protein